MRHSVGAASALLGAVATVAALLPIVPVNAQSNTTVGRRPAGDSALAIQSSTDQNADVYLRARDASKRYGTIAILVIKGRQSEYPRTSQQTAELIGRRFKRLLNTNTMIFAIDAKEGRGVAVMYFVNNSLVKSYSLDEAVKPETMRRIVNIFNAATVSQHRQP